jgi:hypothetical protein
MVIDQPAKTNCTGCWTLHTASSRTEGPRGTTTAENGLYWFQCKGLRCMAKMKAINSKITEIVSERPKDGKPQEMQQAAMKITEANLMVVVSLIKDPDSSVHWCQIGVVVQCRGAMCPDSLDQGPVFAYPASSCRSMALTNSLQTALNPAPPDLRGTS